MPLTMRFGLLRDEAYFLLKVTIFLKNTKIQLRFEYSSLRNGLSSFVQLAKRYICGYCMLCRGPGLIYEHFLCIQ